MLKFEVITEGIQIKNGAGGGSPEKILEISTLPITIGKLATCNICIDDASVTRIHAKIESIGGGYQIADRASAKGTFVNGQRVTKSKFASGDVLKFGNVEVRVTCEEADAQAEAPAPAAAAATPAAAPAEAAAATPAATPAAAPAAATPAAAPAKPAVPRSTAGFGAKKSTSGNPLNNPFAKKETPKKKPRRQFVSFERRFLSEKMTDSKKKGILEIGVTWCDKVISVTQYEAREGALLTIGAEVSLATIPVENDRIGRIAPLVYFDGQRWTLFYADWMGGYIITDANGTPNQKVELADASKQGLAKPFEKPMKLDSRISTEIKAKLRESLSVTVDGVNRIKIVINDIAIYVHYVPQVTRIGGAVIATQSSNVLSKGFIVSFTLHALILLLVFFSTDRVDALAIDKLLTSSRFAETLATPEEEQEEEKEDEEDKEEEDEPEEAEVVDKNNNDVGKEDVKVDKADNSVKLTKEQNTEAAMNAGLLAQTNEMSSLLGAGFDAGGFDAIDDWGSFDQSAAAGIGSGYGLNMAGAGRSGGGSQGGGFGAGTFGTVGRGGGGGAGRDYGMNAASDMGERKQAQIKLKPGNPEVSGSLDKRIVQKVVKQHHGELRACYEKEVAKKKGLSGKIIVRWIIEPQGSVMKAVVMSTTMNDSAVEGCVVNSIKYWRFPPLKGGVPVQIDYPFVFELGGS